MIRYLHPIDEDSTSSTKMTLRDFSVLVCDCVDKYHSREPTKSSAQKVRAHFYHLLSNGQPSNIDHLLDGQSTINTTDQQQRHFARAKTVETTTLKKSSPQHNDAPTKSDQLAKIRKTTLVLRNQFERVFARMNDFFMEHTNERHTNLKMALEKVALCLTPSHRRRLNAVLNQVTQKQQIDDFLTRSASIGQNNTLAWELIFPRDEQNSTAAAKETHTESKETQRRSAFTTTINSQQFLENLKSRLLAERTPPKYETLPVDNTVIIATAFARWAERLHTMKEKAQNKPEAEHIISTIEELTQKLKQHSAKLWHSPITLSTRQKAQFQQKATRYKELTDRTLSHTINLTSDKIIQLITQNHPYEFTQGRKIIQLDDQLPKEQINVSDTVSRADIDKLCDIILLNTSTHYPIPETVESQKKKVYTASILAQWSKILANEFITINQEIACQNNKDKGQKTEYQNEVEKKKQQSSAQGEKHPGSISTDSVQDLEHRKNRIQLTQALLLQKTEEFWSYFTNKKQLTQQHANFLQHSKMILNLTINPFTDACLETVFSGNPYRLKLSAHTTMEEKIERTFCLSHNENNACISLNSDQTTIDQFSTFCTTPRALLFSQNTTLRDPNKAAKKILTLWLKTCKRLLNSITPPHNITDIKNRELIELFIGFLYRTMPPTQIDEEFLYDALPFSSTVIIHYFKTLISSSPLPSSAMIDKTHKKLHVHLKQETHRFSAREVNVIHHSIEQAEAPSQPWMSFCRPSLTKLGLNQKRYKTTAAILTSIFKGLTKSIVHEISHSKPTAPNNGNALSNLNHSTITTAIDAISSLQRFIRVFLAKAIAINDYTGELRHLRRRTTEVIDLTHQDHSGLMTQLCHLVNQLKGPHTAHRLSLTVLIIDKYITESTRKRINLANNTESLTQVMGAIVSKSHPFPMHCSPPYSGATPSPRSNSPSTPVDHREGSRWIFSAIDNPATHKARSMSEGGNQISVENKEENKTQGQNYRVQRTKPRARSLCSSPAVPIHRRSMSERGFVSSFRNTPENLTQLTTEHCYSKFLPGYGQLSDKNTLLKIGRMLIFTHTLPKEMSRSALIRTLNTTTEDNLLIFLEERTTDSAMTLYDEAMLKRIQQDEYPTQIAQETRHTIDPSLSFQQGDMLLTYNFKTKQLTLKDGQPQCISNVQDMIKSPITGTLFITRSNGRVSMLKHSGALLTFNQNSASPVTTATWTPLSDTHEPVQTKLAFVNTSSCYLVLA